MRAKARQKRAKAREEMWPRLAQQPGTHLLWVRAGIGNAELRTAEQQTIAALRRILRSDLGGRMTVSVGGRSFTVKGMKVPGHPPAWPPGIAEIIGQPEAGSYEPIRAVNAGVLKPRELIDETGTPILYSYGRHFRYVAGACITFPDLRWLEFPVQGP